MKKRKLSQRGKMTLAAISFVACLGLLNLLPNTDNYEVRTMRVVEETDEMTYLIDGNNHVYGMTDKVYNKNEKLYVTLDNKGTSDLTDDIIVNWRYRD